MSHDWDEAVHSIPEDERVVLLQYNTHLFAGSKATGIVREGDPPPLTFRDDERTDFIAERIEASGADVVTLNEVWGEAPPRGELVAYLDDLVGRPVDKVLGFLADEWRRTHTWTWPWERKARFSDGDLQWVALNYFAVRKGRMHPASQWATAESQQERLVKRLSQEYPYHCEGPKESALCNNSGLLLFSKWPIVDCRIVTYERNRANRIPAWLDKTAAQLFSVIDIKTSIPQTLDNEEDWARKGVLVATIEHPHSGRFVVHATHTGGPEDLQELKNCVEQSSEPAKIIVGDLNVHRSDGEELTGAMGDLGAVDAWVDANVGDDGNTIDRCQNRLDQYFSAKGAYDPSNEYQVDRLDYAFSTQPMEPVAARVIRDWTWPVDESGEAEQWDLSDHYPLEVAFRVGGTH